MANPSTAVRSRRTEVPNLIFVQVSDQLMMTGGADAKWVDDYYTDVYKYMPGYGKPEHYMELPYWVSIISGMAQSHYSRQLHVVTDVAKSAEELRKLRGTLVMSTIESNAAATHELVKLLPESQIIMGGHVSPEEFSKYPNVTFLGSPKELLPHLSGLDVNAAPDNVFFKGQKTNVRLTLSTGCQYACDFCMVPRQVETLSDEHIWAQVEQMSDLDFELVYLDDKTFGQAPNWRMIGPIGKYIRTFNPNFKGFVVQTTANIAAGAKIPTGANMDDFRKLGVKYVEIGVESVHEDTFKAMMKPYQLKHIQQAMENARRLNMPIIPNFLMGHPLDNGRYADFVRWTWKYRDVIAAININFLSPLYGAKEVGRARNHRADLPVAETREDADQNSYAKSWLSHQQTAEMLAAARATFFLTTGKDYIPERFADEFRRMSAADVVARALDTSDSDQAIFTGKDAEGPSKWQDPIATEGIRKPEYWRDFDHSDIYWDASNDTGLEQRRELPIVSTR